MCLKKINLLAQLAPYSLGHLNHPMGPVEPKFIFHNMQCSDILVLYTFKKSIKAHNYYYFTKLQQNVSLTTVKKIENWFNWLHSSHITV